MKVSILLGLLALYVLGAGACSQSDSPALNTGTPIATNAPDTQVVTLGELVGAVKQGQVNSIEVHGDILYYYLADNVLRYESKLETGTTIQELLEDNGVSSERLPKIEVLAP
jgi:hypothetical protein